MNIIKRYLTKKAIKKEIENNTTDYKMKGSFISSFILTGVIISTVGYALKPDSFNDSSINVDGYIAQQKEADKKTEYMTRRQKVLISNLHKERQEMLYNNLRTEKGLIFKKDIESYINNMSDKKRKHYGFHTESNTETQEEIIIKHSNDLKQRAEVRKQKLRM
jgi:hypothetical protein